MNFYKMPRCCLLLLASPPFELSALSYMGRANPRWVAPTRGASSPALLPHNSRLTYSTSDTLHVVHPFVACAREAYVCWCCGSRAFASGSYHCQCLHPPARRLPLRATVTTSHFGLAAESDPPICRRARLDLLVLRFQHTLDVIQRHVRLCQANVTVKGTL